MNEVKFLKYLNVYEFETILPGIGKTIKFKPITGYQMKKLLTYENEDNSFSIEEILDEMMNDCIITENFDIRDVDLQDRFFFLVELRKKTTGSQYKFQYTCLNPKCGSQNLTSIDLNKLPYNPKSKNEEDYLVKLDDNISIKLRFSTRRDTLKAIEEVDTLNITSNLQREAEILTRVFAYIVEEVITPDGIDKNVPFELKMKLIDSIPDAYDKINEWFDKSTYGVEFLAKIKCKQCGQVKEVGVPLENFFNSSI